MTIHQHSNRPGTGCNRVTLYCLWKKQQIYVLEKVQTPSWYTMFYDATRVLILNGLHNIQSSCFASARKRNLNLCCFAMVWSGRTIYVHTLISDCIIKWVFIVPRQKKGVHFFPSFFLLLIPVQKVKRLSFFILSYPPTSTKCQILIQSSLVRWLLLFGVNNHLTGWTKVQEDCFKTGFLAQTSNIRLDNTKYWA